MTTNKIKGKRIIATVTNPLFHDKRMERICSTLSKEGAEVTLVGVYRKNVPQPSTKLYSHDLLRMFFSSGFLFYAEYNIRLFFYLIIRSFDLVISVDLDSLPAGYLARKLKNKKGVYDAHEYFTEVPEVENRRFVKSVWSLVAKIFIGGNNITVSQSLAKELENKYGKFFHLVRNVPNYIQNQSIPKSLPEEGDINLLYIGYLNEGRGLETLIKSMHELPDRFKLRLIGGGDIQKDLENMVMRYGIENRVVFEGWIVPSEFKKYLANAHIGLNLLDSRSKSYFYSLANKTFDYMYFGIPALHMDFPEYRQLQKEYGGIELVKSLDVAEIKKLLISLVEDKARYTILSQQNLASAKHLDWNNEKHRLVEYINTILN